MSFHCVVYELRAHADGAIDITVTTTTGLTVTRRGLTGHAEAETALQDLRAILAAQGLDLIHARGPALT